MQVRRLMQPRLWRRRWPWQWRYPPAVVSQAPALAVQGDLMLQQTRSVELVEVLVEVLQGAASASARQLMQLMDVL